MLIKQALGLPRPQRLPGKEKVGVISLEQIKKIAETKFNDLNARDVDHACRIIAGTAGAWGWK